MGDLWSAGEYWSKMAPTPNLEASTSTINGRDGLGVIKIGSELNLFFSSLKASSGPLTSQSGNRCDKGTKMAYKPPKKDLGIGQVITAEILLGSIWTLPKRRLYSPGQRNRIAVLRQANCSYSEIYKTLKAEEIPISLSAIKIIGKRFETTGNVARKKGSGRPKASSYRDDHLLKCTVLKERKISLQKLSAEFKTSVNKTLSRRTITRGLSNAGFVSRRCVKKPLGVIWLRR